MLLPEESGMNIEQIIFFESPSTGRQSVHLKHTNHLLINLILSLYVNFSFILASNDHVG